MQPDLAYELLTAHLMQNGQLTVRRGKGGLSYYKHGVFVCHFNAWPQRRHEDLGFADFRYEGLRPYLDVQRTIAAIQKDALPEVQIKPHEQWCSLHFPLTRLEHIGDLFLRHIISKVNS